MVVLEFLVRLYYKKHVLCRNVLRESVITRYMFGKRSAPFLVQLHESTMTSEM